MASILVWSCNACRASLGSSQSISMACYDGWGDKVQPDTGTVLAWARAQVATEQLIQPCTTAQLVIQTPGLWTSGNAGLRPSPSSDSLTVAAAGHSLGGALAKLAAHSFAGKRLAYLAKAPSTAQPIRQPMLCYTFGAPRVGNCAWAKECGAMVPAIFNIINDQVP